MTHTLKLYEAIFDGRATIKETTVESDEMPEIGTIVEFDDGRSNRKIVSIKHSKTHGILCRVEPLSN